MLGKDAVRILLLAVCKAHSYTSPSAFGGQNCRPRPQPEKQAKKVLLNKWKPRAPWSAQVTPDAAIAKKFRETFAEPLSSAKRAAMSELFLMAGARMGIVLPDIEHA